MRDGVRELWRGGNRQSCGKGGEEEKSLASRCVCAGVPTPHPDLGPRHGYHHRYMAARGHLLLLVVSWTRNQLRENPMKLFNWPSDGQLPHVSVGSSPRTPAQHRQTGKTSRGRGQCPFGQ